MPPFWSPTSRVTVASWSFETSSGAWVLVISLPRETQPVSPTTVKDRAVSTPSARRERGRAYDDMRERSLSGAELDGQ